MNLTTVRCTFAWDVRDNCDSRILCTSFHSPMMAYYYSTP